MTKNMPNIDYMLKAAKDYIDGTGDDLSFELDYGYELEKRYKAMVNEDATLADLIFDCLVREGSDYATTEIGDKLRARVKKQYDYVMSVYQTRK